MEVVGTKSPEWAPTTEKVSQFLSLRSVFRALLMPDGGLFIWYILQTCERAAIPVSLQLK